MDTEAVTVEVIASAVDDMETWSELRLVVKHRNTKSFDELSNKGCGGRGFD